MAKPKKQTKLFGFDFFNYWSTTNYIFLIAGIILLIVGYYFMSIRPWDSNASLNISPIILIIAYLIVLPASILYSKKKKEEESK
jgi:membrane protein YdbS with pleckstrin-like domain